MRVVQYKILTRLLNKISIPDYIFAFEKNKSIPSMAQMHTKKEVVISLDIKNFFPSINQNTIADILVKLGIGESPARTISEICTFKHFVPQGALTSPKISNLISALSFGPIIKRFCDDKGLTLSIYADDITISSSDKEVNIGEVLSFVTKTVQSFGFRINKTKTKVMKKHIRQYVCGVVVNEKTNMLKRERRQLRAIVHNVTTKGLAAEAHRSNLSEEEFSSTLRGRVNWLVQLNPLLGTKLMDKLISSQTPEKLV